MARIIIINSNDTLHRARQPCSQHRLIDSSSPGREFPFHYQDYYLVAPFVAIHSFPARLSGCCCCRLELTDYPAPAQPPADLSNAIPSSPPSVSEDEEFKVSRRLFTERNRRVQKKLQINSILPRAVQHPSAVTHIRWGVEGKELPSK